MPTTPAAPSDRPYAAHPHLHGDRLVFTADGDVWSAPTDGGGAVRLTEDGSRVGHPRISPDGSLLAWTSARDGMPEAYAVPLDGSRPPRRLTHFGHARTRVAGWTPGGEVLVLSAQHTHSPIATWAWAVSPDGGAPRRLPFGPIGDLAYGPLGQVVLRSVTMLPQAAYWKGYRGGAVGRLWLGDTAGARFAPLVPKGHDEREAELDCPMWLTGAGGDPDDIGDTGRVAFLSDAGGLAGLWSSLPDGSDPRPHTPDTAHPGFAARNAATDGVRVVYQSAGDLWLFEDTSPGAEPVRVDVRLPGGRPGRAPHVIDATDWAGDFAGGPTGSTALVEVRGTVHLLTAVDGDGEGDGEADGEGDGGGAPVALSARPGVRCRSPRPLGAGGDVVWVSDEEGADALEVVATSPAGQGATSAPAPRVLAAGLLGRVLELCASPDGRTVAVAAHDGRVLTVDVATGAIVELDRSAHEEVTGLAFSPDSAWLAWSHPGAAGLREIRLARAGGGPVLGATGHRFRDEAPAFTSDGGHLAFLSDRVFDPEYETHVLDLGFIAAKRPYLLTLTADAPSPLLDPPTATPPPASGSTPTRVDAEGLADRVVAFPVPAADYSELSAVDGALLWIRTPPIGTLGDRWAGVASPPPRPLLERWNLCARTLETLREGVDAYATTGDGGRLLVRDGQRLYLRRTGGGEAEKGEGAEVALALSRIEVTVHPAAEWAQAFAEDERLMRDNVWRPDLPELDADGGPWALRGPLLERIGAPEEFTDLLWDTHGDLRCSHAYVWPRSAGAGADGERPGLLGADLHRDADGLWRITRILPGDSSAPAARSPLSAPGTGLRAGDALLAVDGRPIDPEDGPAPLLLGGADRPVELTVRAAAGGPVRRVGVVPLASETALRYHDLVARRRTRVREAADGLLGYLHVPDMMATGWAQLHRDLRAEAGADGLLVDFRENSGGHLSSLVLERLARRPVGWQVRRGGTPQSCPEPAARGPLVFLADELSGSDGDNVVAAIRARRLGPVVGVRTWGGVRGMEVRHRLVDGTRLVHPRGAFWFAHGGWDLENNGVEPDVEVRVSPHERARGEDPPLERAIEVALRSLSTTPAVRPPRPAPRR
ncbi:PDZ domain-containing protein [Streptomyces sp. NPDC087917]|uniref:S41 family peptidase n=1 Tax=Streptomyces sp. NPDC087917 TaxID=3155060 RepID=UPI003442FCA1